MDRRAHEPAHGDDLDDAAVEPDRPDDERDYGAERVGAIVVGQVVVVSGIGLHPATTEGEVLVEALRRDERLDGRSQLSYRHEQQAIAIRIRREAVPHATDTGFRAEMSKL